VNFLAHFHLAWPDEELIVGALEGDFRKGPLRGELPHNIEQGVKLHRAIDAFTDTHPLIEQLRRQFPKGLRRYAGIVIDISFDHYLTHNWHRFSSQSLKQFTEFVYVTLDQNKEVLSDRARKMMQRLIDYDILCAYHDWNAVPATASRVGERFRHGNPLREIQPSIEPLRSNLENTFLEFYPDLQEFCQNSPLLHSRASPVFNSISRTLCL